MRRGRDQRCITTRFGLSLAILLFALAGCQADNPSVVLELGARGPQVAPGGTVTLEQGHALYIHFAKIWSRSHAEVIHNDVEQRPPVEVTSGSDSIRLLPDIDGNFWLLIAQAPGQAELTLQKKHVFKVTVVPQPEPAPPVYPPTDAGADAAPDGAN